MRRLLVCLSSLPHLRALSWPSELANSSCICLVTCALWSLLNSKSIQHKNSDFRLVHKMMNRKAATAAVHLNPDLLPRLEGALSSRQEEKCDLAWHSPVTWWICCLVRANTTSYYWKLQKVNWRNVSIFTLVAAPEATTTTTRDPKLPSQKSVLEFWTQYVWGRNYFWGENLYYLGDYKFVNFP